MVGLHQNLVDTLIKKIVLVGTVMHIEKNEASQIYCGWFVRSSEKK